MALFRVDGWNLKSENITFDNSASAKKQRKKKDGKSAKGKKNDSRFENQIVAQEVEPDKESKSLKSNQDHVNSKYEDHSIRETLPPQKKNLTPLQQKMLTKLTGSRFRWINEQLYTITSDEALKLIQNQPQLFDEYHEGFRSQVQSWPENPVDVFVNQIRIRSQKPINAPGGLPGLKDKKIVIADMGCGDARLALEVNEFFKNNNKQSKRFKRCQVHSFDLKKSNDRITVADIRNVPLPNESSTIVIFCLAMMGTNFLDFIREAYRILAPCGELWIAEIKSRFSDGNGDEFVKILKLMGFFHKKTDNENKMFTRFEFFKPPQQIIEERKERLQKKRKFIEVETEKNELEVKRSKIPEGKWLLKPCIYKRR